MNDSASVIYVFISLLIGVGLGFLIGRGRKTTEGSPTADLAVLQTQLIGAQAQVEQLNVQLESERSKSEETIQLRAELTALKEGVAAITRSATDADRRRTEAEAGLRTQIEAMNTNNSALVTQTSTIARVLNSSQSRGRFGEAQLEKLLENAGLIEGQHYKVQRSTSGEGTGRPDVTIAMPGASVLFIDSKFPFENFYQAYATEDEGQREALLKEHSRALRDHIKKLAERGYAQQDTSPDFVILFAPIESILADALRIDDTLLDYSFSQRVTIATPTNMMALLRTVGYLFSRDKVAQNASEIHTLAEKFLDDITKLYDKLNRLGRALKSTVGAYDDVIGAAQNTATRTAKKIRSLDVQGPAPELPVEITQVVREISNASAQSAIEDAEIIEDSEEV
ncbi:MAG: DNA recombination protein RmuC [Actinomycetales bacterium]|nr:DNA recombination protein RmuC [Actinomycetales bacterium]